MTDVLVIDDDPLMRELVSEWLADAGYEPRQAVDGEAGIEALQAQPASLVVTDMNMPRRDGVRTLETLRRDYPQLPVLAMSGHFRGGHGYTQEGALASGARGVLAKPFTRCELIDAVRTLIGPAQTA